MVLVGMGKDEPRAVNKELAAAAGILDSVPDSVASGEGLEDAVATVVSSGLSHTDCALEGSLERGDYWIVIQCRYLNEPDLIRCRRRIRVV